MNFELLRIAIALVGTGLAAWQDHKTSFIDDKITIGMIAAGLILNILAFDYDLWIWAGGIALIIALAGYLAWRTGQFGGGDVLLFLGLHLLLPVYPLSLGSPLVPSLMQYFQYPFVLSVFLASSYLAVIGSALFYAKELVKAKRASQGKVAVIALFCAIALAFLWQSPFSPSAKIFFLLLFASGAILLAFKREIMDFVVVRKLKIGEIEDEDILALDKMPAAIVKKYGLEKVLTKAQVAKLRLIEKKEKMRVFPVCKVLPRFGPYVLAGLIACLIAGDLFFFVLLG